MNKNKDKFPPATPIYAKFEYDEPGIIDIKQIGHLPKNPCVEITAQAIKDMWANIDKDMSDLQKIVISKYMIPAKLFGMPLAKPQPKCECGAEKVKTTHSDWCPKY